MKSRFSFLFFLLTFVLLPLLAISPAAAADTAAGKPPQPAPAFSLATREGIVSADSLRGRLVFLDFWASWCGPCRKSFPWLRDLHDRYAAKGLVIVAVNLDKKREAADAFLRDNQASFTIAFDPAGKTAEAYRVKVMPSSFLISPTGEILYAVSGFDDKHTGPVEALIKQGCTK